MRTETCFNFKRFAFLAENRTWLDCDICITDDVANHTQSKISDAGIHALRCSFSPRVAFIQLVILVFICGINPLTAIGDRNSISLYNILEYQADR